MTSVDRATASDVARFYGFGLLNPWFGYAQKSGRLVQIVGGATEVSPGVWQGFMDMPSHVRTPLAMRYAYRVLQECIERGADVVRATCDASIPGADVFLERIGFIRTGEVDDGLEVWEWRA